MRLAPRANAQFAYLLAQAVQSWVSSNYLTLSCFWQTFCSSLNGGPQ